MDTRVTGEKLNAVTRKAGLETLAGHGGEQGIRIGDNREIAPKQISFALSQIDTMINPVDDRAILNALVCDFGTDNDAGVNKAAALADETGHGVRAPNTPVIVNGTGDYVADRLDATGKPQFAAEAQLGPGCPP